jgi:hypothetical protein
MWIGDLPDKEDFGNFRNKYRSRSFSIRLALVKNYPYNHDYGKET